MIACNVCGDPVYDVHYLCSWCRRVGEIEEAPERVGAILLEIMREIEADKAERQPGPDVPF